MIPIIFLPRFSENFRPINSLAGQSSRAARFVNATRHIILPRPWEHVLTCEYGHNLSHGPHANHCVFVRQSRGQAFRHRFQDSVVGKAR